MYERPYEDPQKVWDCLYEQIPSEEIVAGIMGYYQRETGFKTDALGGWYLHPKDGSNRKFVIEINKGLKDGSTRDQFITKAHNAGGFGIGQWYTKEYLGELYDYLSKNAGSIDDLEAQCKFTVESMKQNEKLWPNLIEQKTALECGRWIGVYYDGASEIGVGVIIEYAKELYDDYGSNR